MTADELKAKIAKRLAADPRLRRLRKRIAEGKATALDSFDYSRICSEIMSAELEEAVLELDDREGVCTELLHDRYDDTNAAAAEIQEQLDRKNGLHLRPRKPAFPAERVQKIAHSLVEPGVPDEKIVRRAGSTATVSMSFHDDFVREQADFRSRAGLKCWITRVTDGKCCPWCSKYAGRYEYGEEPDDIYRRHDNCGCSVTFENGRQRQDVWSKRTWEVPGKDAGAAEPTVLTEEQARELEEKNQPEVLTPRAKSGTMESELGTFRARLQSDANMDREYYETIKARFSHGSDAAKKAFNRYVPNDSIADAAYASTPHYDPHTGRISMNYSADQHNPRGGGATWFHEHGHLIDAAAGNLSSDTDFYEALRRDKSEYTASIIRRQGTRSVEETYRILQDELQDFRSQSGVSDIFNGLSAGVIQGCGYHPSSYWTRELVVQEAFAHMYEAQFDRVRYEQMKHYFPSALARFEELLGGAVK